MDFNMKFLLIVCILEYFKTNLHFPRENYGTKVTTVRIFAADKIR